jgi:hypothetical protein
LISPVAPPTFGLALRPLAIYIDRWNGDQAKEDRQAENQPRGRTQACPGGLVHTERRTGWDHVVDQERWVSAALEMFGSVFGGATAYPKAKEVWRDDERGGALVMDEPVVIHCYTTPQAIQESKNLAALGAFCRRMGREARQGEVGLVVGDEYFAIQNFAED